MNDTLIINTISKTYFVILSIFAFIVLSFISIFIILQNGLYIDEITIKDIHVEELYIKWNEKLDISAKEILIHPHKSTNTAPIPQDFIKSSLKKIALASSIVNSIKIKQFQIDDIQASLFYQEAKEGYLNLSSQKIQLTSSISVHAHYMKILIKDAHTLDKDIHFQGTFYINRKNFKIYAKTTVNIHNDINITSFIMLHNTQLKYALQNNQKIKSIRYLVDTLQMPKAVQYWLLDAIKMDYLSIENAHGYMDFNHLENAIKNLKVQASLHKLDYIYNPKLDAIHTAVTKLKFEKGILFIYPKKSYSYGMYLDKSWLKIDFTQKEELLTLHLLFDDGMLNKDVLHILNTYKIKLPFLQHTGKVSTNLTIKVGLRNIKIDAKGNFFTKNANFDYLGLNIDVPKAHIQLDNYDVKINNMLASYQDIADANVSVVYNAKNSQGKIFLQFSKIDIAQKKVQLHTQPLQIVYAISPQRDSIHIDKSTWLVNAQTLVINPMDIPFDLHTLTAQIPTTLFDSPKITNGFIGGSINIKKQTASFNVDLLSFKYKMLKLKNSNTQIKVTYNKKLTLSSSDDIELDADGYNINISDLLLDITPQTLHLYPMKVNINDVAFTQISSKYHFQLQKNNLHLNYLRIVDNNISFYKKNNLNLNINLTPASTIILAENLDSQFIINKNSWKFRTKSLDKIAKDSPLLQKLKITQGKLTLGKKQAEKAIYANAYLHYPYPFLLSHNKKIKNYHIKAHFFKDKIKFNVNDTVKVNIDDTIKIQVRNTTLDLQGLLKIKNNVKLPQTKSKPKTILLDATNVALQLTPTRKILSDTIAMQSDHNTTTLQLKYKNAIAGFKIKDKVFHLYGSKFNDTFMENLFSLSKFKGGELEFSVKGSLDDFSGAFYIHDTTVIDYKLLNNILAFVNTVPSLLTFSLPDYNKNGLAVQTAYAKFHTVKGLFKISDFLVHSQELDILGKGNADFYKDTIDLTLNLKTDLGSDARKIPLVGYILFDKDVISTSMKITGKLSNPDVHSLLARDIAIAPLNILKRTILLPYTIVSDIIGDNKKEKKK